MRMKSCETRLNCICSLGRHPDGKEVLFLSSLRSILVQGWQGVGALANLS